MSASNKKKLRKEQYAAQLTEKQQQEQKETKQLKAYTTAFVAILAAVVLIAAITFGITTYNNSGIPQRNTNALTIGEHTLNNVDLGYFYTNIISTEFNNMYNTYGENTSFYAMLTMNLDITKPLNKQYYSEDVTFAEHYTQLAIDKAVSAYNFYDMAVAAGHTLSEDEQKELDSTIGIIELYAELGGYKNPTAYLQDMYGKAADEESYRRYSEVNALAQSYQRKYYDNLSYTDEELDAYNEAHYNDYSTFSYSTFPINVEDYIACSADPDGKEHAHTEAELSAALKAAEEVANKIVGSSATNVEELDAAIKAIPAYAEDNSDLFSEKSFDAIPSIFVDWVVSSERKAGDLAVIPNITKTTAADGTETETNKGYFVILYQERNDNNMNLVTVRHILSEFEGGTTDSSTGKVVYSDAEKRVAQNAIEEVKKKFEAAAAKDEDAFIALVKDNTDDTATSETGGLLEKIYPGYTVTNFNDWCFDESRKAGDYEVVETEYGYHLIYFVRQEETTYRELQVESAKREEDYKNWYNAAIDAAKYTVLDTSKLDLDLIIAGY